MKEMNNEEKKTRLRAPPRTVELIQTLDTIKINRTLGEVKHYFYVRITLIITDIISLCLGIYILFKYDDFLSKAYNCNFRALLLFFVFVYSPSAIGIFFISLILSLFIYTFYWCFEKEKIHGSPLYDENDIRISLLNKDKDDTQDNINKLRSQNKKSQQNNTSPEEETKKEEIRIEEEYIGINADKVTLFPYTMTVFVIMTITFYFIALPLSIILLVKLWDDPVYQDKSKFWVLYILILANLINGILIVVVFFHMFIVKRKENSLLKKNMEINESKIRNYRNEVRQALKNAK